MTPQFLYVISIGIIVLVSGSLLPFSLFGKSYAEFLLLGLILNLPILYSLRKNIRVKLGAFLYLILFLSFIILHAGFFFSTNLGSVLGIFGRTILAFIPSIILSPPMFASIYSLIIYWYSLLSLSIYIASVCLSFFQIYLYQSLPIIENDAGNEFASLFNVYFYKVGILIKSGPVIWDFRNAGLFWEAGAFACFLGFGLFFLLNSPDINFSTPPKTTRIIVISLSILSTLSTLAPFILFISFFPRIYRQALVFRYTVLKMLGVFLATLILVATLISFHDKLSDSSNISTLDRSIGSKVDLHLAIENPLTGLGYENYTLQFKENALQSGSIYPTSTNSFLGRAAVNGIPFSILTFFPILFFIRKLSYGPIQKLSFLILYITLFSSQGLINHPIFLAMSFLGV